MARKVVKITINHHNSGDHLSTTTTTTTAETIPTGNHIISQGRNTTTKGLYATQLTNLKVEFQAGKIKQCLCNWKHLTSDIEILQTVLGLPIELTDDLVQTHLHHCSQKHQLVIDDEIEKLLQKNMITRCDHEKEEIISPIFFKKENRWFIYILSLKSLNKSIETQHFKTETITSILTYWSHLICILLRLT